MRSYTENQSRAQTPTFNPAIKPQTSNMNRPFMPLLYALGTQTRTNSTVPNRINIIDRYENQKNQTLAEQKPFYNVNGQTGQKNNYNDQSAFVKKRVSLNGYDRNMPGHLRISDLSDIDMGEFNQPNFNTKILGCSLIDMDDFASTREQSLISNTMGSFNDKEVQNYKFDFDEKRSSNFNEKNAKDEIFGNESIIYCARDICELGNRVRVERPSLSASILSTTDNLPRNNLNGHLAYNISDYRTGNPRDTVEISPYSHNSITSTLNHFEFGSTREHYNGSENRHIQQISEFNTYSNRNINNKSDANGHQNIHSTTINDSVFQNRGSVPRGQLNMPIAPRNPQSNFRPSINTVQPTKTSISTNIHYHGVNTDLCKQITNQELDNYLNAQKNMEPTERRSFYNPKIQPKKSALKKAKSNLVKKVTIAEHNNRHHEVSKWLQEANRSEHSPGFTVERNVGQLCDDQVTQNPKPPQYMQNLYSQRSDMNGYNSYNGQHVDIRHVYQVDVLRENGLNPEGSHRVLHKRLSLDRRSQSVAY